MFHWLFNLFSGKCQSPGSCLCHSKSELSNPYGRCRNGLYVKNYTKADQAGLETGVKQMVLNSPPFGLRKSSSLESLQLMMQDLQKEQLEKVGGKMPAFGSTRHGTVRVGRSRETNESFRNAVDRSYDMKQHLNMPNIGTGKFAL